MGPIHYDSDFVCVKFIIYFLTVCITQESHQTHSYMDSKTEILPCQKSPNRNQTWRHQPPSGKISANKKYFIFYVWVILSLSSPWTPSCCLLSLVPSFFLVSESSHFWTAISPVKALEVPRYGKEAWQIVFLPLIADQTKTFPFSCE